MSAPLTLSAEFRKLVEAQMDKVLKGIEVTFNEIIEKQKITPTELKDELESLEESFNFLFQKWSLEILYSLMLKDSIGFGEIKNSAFFCKVYRSKKILTVNSRTLSDKLKMLQKHCYITRNVMAGPPLRVEYTLTPKGKNTVLLALPLLYYSSSA